MTPYSFSEPVRMWLEDVAAVIALAGMLGCGTLLGVVAWLAGMRVL